jgi:hypothetical protein
MSVKLTLNLGATCGRSIISSFGGFGSDNVFGFGSDNFETR